MRPRGIALIGCGAIAQNHLGAIRDIPGARLAGVAARRAEKARETGEREGCPWTADYRELLRRSDVDLVDIATSSGSHAAIALDALDAGKHVLVEKPMAMTSEEAERVLARARERRLTLSVVSQRRFEEQHAAVRKVLDGGALGKLLVAEAACPYFRTQEYYDSAAWRGTIAEDGGALMNQSIHSVDLLLWLAGPVRAVYAKTATRTHRMEAEDVALALVTFEGGAFGSVLASTSVRPGFPPTLNFYGEQGSIRLEGAEIVHWTVPDVPRPAPAPFAASAGYAGPKVAGHLHHRLQLEDVLDAIETGRRPAVTGEDGLRAVEFVEAVYRSAKEGAPVEFSP